MKERIMEIMQEYGYSSHAAIARALHEKIAYYRDGKSGPRITAVFLSQILLGRRRMPRNLVDGLVELCEGDERLTSLLEHTEASKTKVNVEYHLTKVFDQYDVQLRSHYVSIGDSEKLKLLTDFQLFVRIHTGLETKINEDAKSES